MSILFVLLFMVSTHCLSQPYSGTIFIDPDILTSSDPSALLSTTYTGQGTRIVYDRRTSAWETINAYLFNVVWSDGLTTEAQVNPEFGSVEDATVEAEKYALIIGRLPTCLRVHVNSIWIHKGTEPFGGGNNAILIHTGQSALYEAQGILEETIIHEASHTSLDAAHASSSTWVAAQAMDAKFISTYAAFNPTREDIAESFLTWLAIRQCSIRISQRNYDTIIQTIPNRIMYFDKQNLKMFPLCMLTGLNEIGTSDFSVYPCPASNSLTINAPGKDLQLVEFFDMQGKLILRENITDANHTIFVNNLDNGIYQLIGTYKDGKRYAKKWIKN